MNLSDYEKTVHYALFHAIPALQPPFKISLGIGSNIVYLEKCESIPDGIDKIISHTSTLILSPTFTLLYPIYLEAMNTDYESTMLTIAWLIKEPADKNGWKFDRIGGYTNTTEKDFVAAPPANRMGGSPDKN